MSTANLPGLTLPLDHLVGSGHTEDGSDDIGGVLSVEDALLLAETADDRPNVTATDLGGTVKVEFPGQRGTTEILLIGLGDAEIIA